MVQVRLKEHETLRNINKPGSEHLLALKEATQWLDSGDEELANQGLDVEEEKSNMVLKQAVMQVSERKLAMIRVSRDRRRRG